MTIENPLLTKSPLPLEAPPFDWIEAEHFLPAFEVGMQEELLEIQRITNLSGSGSPPTFENTIEAMELAGSTLKRVSSIFFNLCSANTAGLTAMLVYNLNMRCLLTEQQERNRSNLGIFWEETCGWNHFSGDVAWLRIYETSCLICL